MRDALPEDFAEFFKYHPLAMVIFGPDLCLERVNDAAWKLWPASAQLQPGVSLQEFFDKLAIALNAKLINSKSGQVVDLTDENFPSKPGVEDEYSFPPLILMGDDRIITPAFHRLNSGAVHLTLTEEPVAHIDKNSNGVAIPAVSQSDRFVADHNANAILFDVVESLEEGFALWDKDMRFVMCNQKYHDMVFAPFGNDPPGVGESADSAIGREFDQGVFDVPEGVTKDEFVQFLIEWVASYGDYNEQKFSNGSTIVFNCNQTNLGGYLITATDLTDQLKAEGLFTEIIELMPVGIIVENAEGELTHSNEAWRRFFGLSEEDVSSMNRDERLQQNYQSVIEVNGVPCQGVPFEANMDTLTAFYENSVPYEVKLEDGRYLFIEIVRTRGGDAIVVLTDTTAAKSTQEDRLASINDVFDGIGEALVLYDKDGKYVLSNESYRELYGLARNPPQAGETFESVLRRLIDQDFYDLPAEVSKDEFFKAGVESFYNRSAKSDFPISAADGRILVASSHQTRLDGYLIAIRDVTEERNSEAKARDMLYDAFQALDESLVLCDENMNYLFGNDVWKKRHFDGYEELIPKPGDSVVENLIKHIKSGYYAIPDTMSEDEYAAWMMGEMAQHGKQSSYTTADGRHFIGSSHQTAFGGSLLFIREVTRQKKAEEELKIQRETAHQNEKLSALGELLAGVAHELNNPLSVVVGYSQMLQGQLPSDSQNEKIDRINQAAERSARIVKTFLAMARQKPSELEVCSLSEVVEVAMDVAGYGLRSSGVEIELDCAEALPPVLIDRDQLAQVFSNLIVNAEQATAMIDRPAEVRFSLSFDQQRDEVVASIIDNGIGIAEETVTRIFDPFFTTKDVGKGTGFGLAFCHRIVTNHHGKLTVSSQQNVGSTFTIRLPASSAQQISSPKETPPQLHASNRPILIVDDEPLVAELAAEILTDCGYKAQCVNSPIEAIEIAVNGDFEAILSDMKMPEMSGEQFWRALLARCPEYEGRIGFVTGDALSEGINQFLASDDIHFIKKPIMANELEALTALLCTAGKAPQ